MEYLIEHALTNAVLFVILLHVTHGHTVVQTFNGPVKGHALNISGEDVVGSGVSGINMFLGIPYAEVPVGALRFARPVTKQPWNPMTLDALEVKPACPQPSWFLNTYSFPSNLVQISEDCLHLNIYSPQYESAADRYPVMVWIHGGSYKYGSGAEYDGRILAQEGVIVVTINYRLGALGFLSTDDDVAPGNYGLLDQLMALQWVKDNIGHFHGDPDKITIFGQSAGGGSVSLHMFSARAYGLFRSAIPQSGCALSPWAIYRPPHNVRTYTTALATAVGCTTTTSEGMLHCLRTKSVDEIIKTNVGGPPMIATFAPRVDGYYITDLPEVLLARGEYLKHVDVMTGFVPQEVAEDLENEPGIDNGLSQQHLEEIFYNKSRRYLDHADDMFAALKCAYPPSNTNVILNRDLAINMNSDYGYVVPHIKMTEQLHKQGTRVWLYDFTYRSANSRKKDWIGVPHAEELYYEFGAPFLIASPCPHQRDATCPVTWGHYQTWSLEDKQMSKQTMELWANFAKLRKQGDSFQVSSSTILNWPQYGDSEISLNISKVINFQQLQKTKGIRFWASYNYLNISTEIPAICRNDIVVG